MNKNENEEVDVVLTPVDPPPPPHLPPALNTLSTVSLLIIATILTAVALSYTHAMMVPFVFALFFSYFVAPGIGLLKHRWHFPHWLAVVTTMFGVLLACFVFGLVVHGSVLRMIDSFYAYEEKLAQVTQSLVTVAAKFDIQLDHASIMARVHDLPIFSYVQSAAGATLGFLADFLVVMVFLTFLVSGRNTGEKKTGLADEIDRKIRAYILTKIVSNMVGASLIWLLYVSLGLDMSLMFAMLAFILGFIPSIGSIIAVFLPLPIAYLQYENTFPFWAVLAGPIVIQTVLGNVVEPKFLGKGLDLHPVTILLSLMFWGIIWGPAGTFLAVPITAVLKIMLERHPLTHKISEVLAGRSPL
ncbi:MAG: AI-2E family transporter [Bdellovibrionota bacterium]